MPADNELKFTAKLDINPIIKAAKDLAKAINDATKVKTDNAVFAKGAEYLSRQKDEIRSINKGLAKEERYKNDIAAHNKMAAEYEEKTAKLSDLIRGRKKAQGEIDDRKAKAIGLYSGRTDKAALDNQKRLVEAQQRLANIDAEIVKTEGDISKLEARLESSYNKITKSEEASRNFTQQFESAGEAAQEIQNHANGISDESNKTASYIKEQEQAIRDAEEATKSYEKTSKDANANVANSYEEASDKTSKAAKTSAEKAREAFDNLRNARDKLGDDWGLNLDADVTKMDDAALTRRRDELQGIVNVFRDIKIPEQYAEFFNRLNTALIETKTQLNSVHGEIKKSFDISNLKVPDLTADVAKMSKGALDVYKSDLNAFMKALRDLGLETSVEYDKAYQALIKTDLQLKQVKADAIDAATPKKETKLTFGVDADLTKMTISQIVLHLSELKSKMKEVGEGSEEFKKYYDAAVLAQKAINDYNNDLKNTGKAAGDASSQTRQAMSMMSQGARMVSNAIKSIENAFKRLLNVVKNIAKKIISTFKTVASTILSSLKNAFDRIGKSSDRAFSMRNLKRSFQMLTKYIFGVRSFFFLYRKLRSAVKDGLENLVQFESASNETNVALTELRTSLLFLKNAWAAAFAPIINYVYPVLVSLLDLLASVGNAIARFVATLTGQATVLQAIRVDAGDYAESLKAAGGAAGKAAKAQDDLNDRLAAFDDLNVLGVDDDKDKTGGGGGGGADDLLPSVDEMFERIETPIGGLAALIKQAWETGDAFGLGNLFAEQLGRAIDNATAWLKGEGHNKIQHIASLIGTFIDGALSIENLGTKIGELLATAFSEGFEFINTIITPDRAVKIGRQIADVMNTAIPQIVPELGKTLGNLFRSAIAGAWGWITTADFADWGASLAEGFNNFINEMNQEVVITHASKATLEWDAKISEEHTGLNGWEMLGQNIQQMAQGMLDALGEAIGNTDWTALGEGIGQAISQIDVSVLAEDLKTLAGKIKDAFVQIWAGYKEGDPEGAQKLSQGFGGLIKLASGLGSIIGPVILLGAGLKIISDALLLILPLVSALAPFIGAGGGGAGFAAGLTAIGAALSPVALTLLIVTAAIAGVLETLAAVQLGFKDGQEGAQSFGGMLLTLFGGALPTLVYWIEYVRGRFKGMVEEIENGHARIQNIGDAISSNAATLFLFIRSLWITFKDTVVRGIELIVSNLTSFKEFIVAIFSGDVIGALNIAIGAIETFVNACIDALAGLANNPTLGGLAGAAGRALNITGSDSHITLPRIPALAQGAVIPPNKEFLAILGDQSSGTNIEAPLDTIRAAVGEELAPYLEQLIEINRQVISAINNKPVINYRDIGKGYTTYTNEQKMMKGSML